MRDPIQIILKTEMLTLEGIKQYYVNLNDDSDKKSALYLTYHILMQKSYHR